MTWREVAREVGKFDSAVVSGLLAGRGPVSARCEPRVDRHRRVIVIGDPSPVAEGKASLLFHRHDDRLWKLRSCLMLGSLRPEGDEWSFETERFVPGMGIGGPLSYVRLMRNGRRTAANYLAHRNIPRPAVQWAEISDLLHRAGEPPDETWDNHAGAQAP